MDKKKFMIIKDMKIPASHKDYKIIFVPKEEMSIDELKHYGVLGMKWGVRKDPVSTWASSERFIEKKRRKADMLRAKIKRGKTLGKDTERKEQKLEKIVSKTNKYKKSRDEIFKGKLATKMSKKEVIRVQQHQKAATTAQFIGQVLGGPIAGITLGMAYEYGGRAFNKDLKYIYKKYGKEAQEIYDATHHKKK